MVFRRSESCVFRVVCILTTTVCCLNVMVLLSGNSERSRTTVLLQPTLQPTLQSTVKTDDGVEKVVRTGLNIKKETIEGVIKSEWRGGKAVKNKNAFKNPVWLPIHDLDKYFRPPFNVLSLGTTRNSKGYVVIGIPTVRRKKAYYLLETVKGLVKNLSEEEQKEVVIVIFIADFNQNYQEKVTKDIKEKFIAEVDSGLIQIIIAPNDYYPSMDDLPLFYGDKSKRVQWRSKQSLDYSFLYYYCADLAEYYIQLEDDVLTEASYLRKIKRFIDKKANTDWSILEFGASGFIGMTYRAKHLKILAKFSRFYFWTMPIDWIFRIFNDIYLYGNNENNIIKPSVFKHVGKHSSLDGQTRKLEDMAPANKEDLEPIYQVKNGNPKAELLTTIEDYVIPHHIEQAYAINGMFWGKAVKENDNIEVIFDKTQNIGRIVILSGSPNHPSDSIESSELYFSNDYNGMSCSNYELAKSYVDLPVIDHYEDPVKSVKCIKLVLTSVRLDEHKRKRWLVIREIAIFSKTMEVSP